jgi:hypothetical protein
MPSGALEFGDSAITLGMNTVDDPKRLKKGECVRLLNMLPEDPPIPRNGCTGKYISAASSSLRFIPPGISFDSEGNVFIVVWVYDGAQGLYQLAILNASTASLEYIGTADYLTSSPLFDFLSLHGCIYCASSLTTTHWWRNGVHVQGGDYGSGLSHKVVEYAGVADDTSIVRDLCISEAGIISSHALTLNGGTLNPGKWVEYAFQHVRRTDTAAFGAGGAIPEILLPYGVTSSYQPKRIDTFLPGVCIGVEDSGKRHTVEIIETLCTPTSAMLSTGISAEAVGSFNATQCVDGNTGTKGFDVDSATAGAWVKIDYGASATRCLTKLDVFTDGAGSTNHFKIQYSDDATTWVDGSLSTVLSAAGWNTITGTALTAHRYWRLYLVDAGTAGPDFMEIRCYGKSGVTITLRNDSYTAYLEGATHLRVSRSLEQDTEALAQAATKYFVCDLPLKVSTVAFVDTTSNATLLGETNQLITGYTVAPAAAFIEYCKGRLFLMGTDGRVYFSESIGGDGGTDLDTAQANPQPWASMFKPTMYLLDCDYVDGQLAAGMKRLGDDLFMFKERKIFALFGGDPLSAAVSQVSNQVGCAFPYTITKCEIKGVFGNCLLFLSNDGPMVMQEGGRIRPFSEFKIKELWPDRSTELYSEIDLDYNWIVQNCTAAFFKNVWWVLYQTKAGVNRIFGYYFHPDLAVSADAPHGAFEFEFASL